MKHQLGMAVANVLYPEAPEPDQNNADALWRVIPDKEKALCLKIAQAVLQEIRKPSKSMLATAEQDITAMLDRMNNGDATDTASVDVVATAFTAMIDEVLRQTKQEDGAEPT